jgi:hypothetical protein
MYSISWNGQSLNTYGVLVKSHALSLARTYDSMQCQDRAWAGKGQGAPCVMTLDIYITGANQAQCEERYWDVRGLLDQEDECELKLDRFNDRYWMAKFDSLSPLTFVGKNVVSATLIFTCHDRAAYATSPSTQTETLTKNISANCGDMVGNDICFDDDYVYVGSHSLGFVYKLNKIDLSLVATSPNYTGNLYCVCCDNSPTGYIYYGGNGGAGQYDMCKLLKSDFTTIVRGPDYGGEIRDCCLSVGGLYVLYGGNGGAGQYDIAKLLVSDMATEIRSVDYGGSILAVEANSTHVFAAGTVTGRVRRYAIADLAYVDQSDAPGGWLEGLALDDLYVYCGGSANLLWRIPLADLTAEVAAAALVSAIKVITVDNNHIYVGGNDFCVFKYNKLYGAGDSFIATSESYGGAVWSMALDAVNNWLYIGGQTTQTVWKLDTRHMPIVVNSGDTFAETRDIVTDNDYAYLASGNKVYKLNKQTMNIVSSSVDYGGEIYALATDDSIDYVYCAGYTTQKVWKLAKIGLTKLAESAD